MTELMLARGSRIICMILYMFPGLDLYCTCRSCTTPQDGKLGSRRVKQVILVMFTQNESTGRMARVGVPGVWYAYCSVLDYGSELAVTWQQHNCCGSGRRFCERLETIDIHRLVLFFCLKKKYWDRIMHTLTAACITASHSDRSGSRLSRSWSIRRTCSTDHLQVVRDKFCTPSFVGINCLNFVWDKLWIHVFITPS